MRRYVDGEKQLASSLTNSSDERKRGFASETNEIRTKPTNIAYSAYREGTFSKDSTRDGVRNAYCSSCPLQRLPFDYMETIGGSLGWRAPRWPRLLFRWFVASSSCRLYFSVIILYVLCMKRNDRISVYDVFFARTSDPLAQWEVS